MSAALQTIKLYPQEFWNWLFRMHFKEVVEYQIELRHDFLRNAKNPWDKNRYTLNVDFDKETCLSITDDKDAEYSIIDYIAQMREYTVYIAREFIQHHHDSWKKEKEIEEERALFKYNKKNAYWFIKKDNEFTILLNFNLIFHSIIKKWNSEMRTWDRFYNVSLEFYRENSNTLEKTHLFTLSPEETHTAKAFSKAVWNVDFLIVNFSHDLQVQRFFSYLNANVYRPMIITEFDHFGFIEYLGRKYYLASNVLIAIPDHDTTFKAIAPNGQGAFQIDDNNYIGLDPSITGAPFIDVGPVDNYTNRFIEFEERIEDLYDNGIDYKERYREVQEKLGQMIGGKNFDKYGGEGAMILAFVFSFHFFDDIYKSFAHIIFLYLYGQPNSGKGRMADLILSFFGIPSTNNQNQPTIRALENGMEAHSKLPLWLDEFVPESPNNKSKISDQLFNVWYELRTRPTSSGSNRKRNEEKIVRCMLMFCSNFIPIADHLNSRALKFEYNFHKRGEEKHYYYLAERKKELQELFFGFLTQYPRIDRKNFRQELIAMKQIVRKAANKLIEEKKRRMGGEFNLEDRQVESVAALVVTHNEVYNRNKEIKYFFDLIDKEENQSVLDHAVDTIKMLRTGHNIVFEQGVRFLADNAQKVGERDDLTSFLSTIEFMVTEGTISEKFYGWQGDDLKIWFEGLWAAYVDRVRDRSVSKDTVKGKIASISTKTEPSTMVWTDSISNTHRKHGFRIPNAAKDHRFQYCFKHNSISDIKEDIPVYGATKDTPLQADFGLDKKSPFDEK